MKQGMTNDKANMEKAPTKDAGANGFQITL
jgi:hypothetical protein